ncbi:hypothetical protein CLF_103491 [Clonorchis sinensis]|uniref:Uncharacterized protein n=1 Tax=Clonorchis sinensis TaxID=79923 RepID=G7Y9U5_CLOSI|nr:hypothetical protein CLF_103491 [Clonorchis sinensis]
MERGKIRQKHIVYPYATQGVHIQCPLCSSDGAPWAPVVCFRCEGKWNQTGDNSKCPNCATFQGKGRYPLAKCRKDFGPGSSRSKLAMSLAGHSLLIRDNPDDDKGLV